MMTLREERRADRTYRTHNNAERLFQPVPDFRNKPLHSGIRHRGITSKSSSLSFRNSGLEGGSLTRQDVPMDDRASEDGEHAMMGLDTELLDSKKRMISGTYLRNAWYVAAWSDDLADSQLLGRTILKQPIVFYRKSDGKVAALQDRCPHRFAPLHMGKVIHGDRVQCPYHGLEFDALGACVHNPHGSRNIPSRARVRSYPVIEKHKAIWIWMGERPADAAKVPDFSVLDNVPQLHSTKRDRITIRANYELIIDNLLDLSHTSYLHEGILGNQETVESEIAVEQEGDDVVASVSEQSAATNFQIDQAQWPHRPIFRLTCRSSQGT